MPVYFPTAGAGRTRLRALTYRLSPRPTSRYALSAAPDGLGLTMDKICRVSGAGPLHGLAALKLVAAHGHRILAHRRRPTPSASSPSADPATMFCGRAVLFVEAHQAYPCRGFGQPVDLTTAPMPLMPVLLSTARGSAPGMLPSSECWSSVAHSQYSAHHRRLNLAGLVAQALHARVFPQVAAHHDPVAGHQSSPFLRRRAALVVRARSKYSSTMLRSEPALA